MKDNQASFTAMTVAYMRAYHSKHDTQKIFDDFLAYDLIPEEKRGLIEQHLIEQNLPLDQQLNYFKHTTLHSNDTTISASLRQVINNAINEQE
jgi:O-methyltransferase involved in polyketide biosynthesis